MWGFYFNASYKDVTFYMYPLMVFMNHNFSFPSHAAWICPCPKCWLKPHKNSQNITIQGSEMFIVNFTLGITDWMDNENDYFLLLNDIEQLLPCLKWILWIWRGISFFWIFLSIQHLLPNQFVLKHFKSSFINFSSHYEMKLNGLVYCIESATSILSERH